MWKIKLFFLCVLLVLAGKITAQDPNWNSWITIPPNPSPYISDWENNPNSITYTLQNYGDVDTEVFLDIGVVSEQHGEVFNGRSQPIIFNSGPEIREISSLDIIDWGSISWNSNIESQVVRTGRFPEGDYFACIIAISHENNFLTESCINFTISYPEAPYLIAPLDEDKINFPQPTFQWTPVLDYSTQGMINYNLKIVEMLTGQTAEQAILANPVHFEFKTTSTTFPYLPGSQDFEDGKSYAWQIQVMDENDIPISNNDGKSEIWSFQYKNVLSLLEGIGFVYDGLSDDEDYTNSKNELSANWETVSSATSYQYSIGTTEGGAEVVPWADNGLSTSFTKSGLKLTDGNKYYVSVRIENNDGSLISSDGITIDTESPSSTLNVDVTVGQIAEKITNNSDFKVSWTSSKSVSPVSFDVQYKYENDFTWRTWLGNTQLKFSTFSSDIMQGDGKYYFSVQVKDLAGNLEVPKEKPEDEILVDTKAPSSSVKKLNTEQMSSNFIVEWSGTDLKPGSGIEYYNIQVKEDIGNWTDWLTKQISTSNTYQGKEGYKYSFRCAATDSAGNIEEYPQTSDATTEVTVSAPTGFSIVANVDANDINSLHNDAWYGKFYSGDIFYHIELKASGLPSEAAVLDSVEFRWYTENLQLFKTKKTELSAPISLKGGQTKKTSVTAKEPDPLPTTSKMELVLYLEIDFIGKDINNKRIKAETQQLKSVHSLVAKSTPLALKVYVTPNSISYAPGWLSNKINVELKLEGSQNSTVTIDKVTNHWYKKDKTKFATLSNQLQTNIKIKSGESKTRKNISMTIDKNSLIKALGGKTQAEYYVDIEYIGKDQNGKEIKGKSEYPLDVIYFSTLSDYTSFSVSVSPKELDYDPSITKHELDLKFSLIGFTKVTYDSYYETLIDENGKKIILPTVALGSNAITLSPGSATTTVYTNNLTIKGIPSKDTTISKNLPANLKGALKGKSSAEYKLNFTYSGKDGNGKKTTTTTNTIKLNVFSQTDGVLTVSVSPTSNTFNVDNLVKNWQASLNYKGKIDITIDSIYTKWYMSHGNGSLIKKNPEGKFSPPLNLKAPTGSLQQQINQTISDLGRYEMMKDKWGESKDTPNKKVVTFDLAINFVGKDAFGRRVNEESNLVKVFLEEPKYPLTVLAIPEKLTTTKEMASVKLVIKSNQKSDIILIKRTTRIKMGTQTILAKGYSDIPAATDKDKVTDYNINYSPLDIVPSNGQYVDINNIPLNLPEILKGNESAECIAEVEYEGKTSNGNILKGIGYIPITVGKPKIVQEQDSLLTQKDDFVIIPKVAVVKAYKDLTTITKQGSNTVLNGPVQLILIPDPFDSIKVAVEATNLSFSPKQGVKNSWEIKSGGFLEEGSALKSDLFSIYKNIMKVNKISYNHSRTNKFLIDKAVAHIPILGKTINFNDLLIDKNGLNLKMAKQEFTAYGFTFSVSDIQKKSNKSGGIFSLTAGIKFPIVNKPLSNKEYNVQVVITDNNGKKNIKINSLSNNPFQLIPGKNYLNFKSFKFVEKSNDNWVLDVEVTSDDLPLYNKLGLGPITSTFTYEKSGKMSGKLEPIKETKTGYDSNDISVVKIGKFGAIDLTYLGLKFAATKKIATVDSKPDTTWEFDPDNSYFGISADLHLPFTKKVLGDATGVINLGDHNKPGIKIDFNGNVSSESISLSSNKKLDLGPIFLSLTKLAITPEPFALAISGGFGVDMENIFTGEIKIEGLKIDSDGKFTNLNQVVKGGNLSILKVVKLGIDNLEYKNSPSKLSFTGGDDNKSNSLQVDNYFRLKGANLSIGKSKAAGGGFDELLVYEYQGKTNFILENGKLSVKDVIDLTIDIQYAKKANEEYLSVGGDATIAKKWGATLYGKIGKRDGDATWGFFAAVKNLQISLAGPVMLDKIGAGFFYRPTKKDIDKVITVAGIKPIKVDKAFSYAKPKGSSEFKCAVFLNAGLIVSEKKLVDGQAMVTITENYFRLDANVKALDGKATGSAFLNINWANKYAEGKFSFGIDNFVLIKAEEKDNWFQFYGYDKKNWGIMGKMDMTCFFIDTKSQFYVGNQGFLFDFGFGYSLDIGVLEGGINLEAMVWWRKDVNWGVYAKGKLWGEFLWGLAGGKAVVEGALISPPFTIYIAGELSLTLCYVEVFDGRVWIAVGENGFDGGTGGNNKYDKLISDAKNIGKQMKDDMEKLAKELDNARNALYQLSEQQRIAAGKALMNLSSWSGGKGIGAVFSTIYKNWHNHDLHSKIYANGKDIVVNSDVADPTLKQIFNTIWNPQAAAFQALETSLKNDSSAIAKAISDIKTKESQLDNLLSAKGDLLSGNLPKLSDLTKLKNPVTKPSLTPSIINGKPVQVFNFTLDSNEVKVLNNTVLKQKKESEDYQNKLMTMVAEYVKKLNEINQILSGSSNSVASIAKDYGDTYDKISKYTTRFIDYMNGRQQWGASEAAKLIKLESDNNKISGALTSQANKLIISSNNFTSLVEQRINFINGLISIGAAKNISPPKTDHTVTNYKDLGKELYYHIPKNGFLSVDSEMNTARQTFVKYFKASNDIYQAKWNNFTVRSDKVYSRQTKLYTILYDLFDQLSLETGTRKQEDDSKQFLAIDTGDNFTNQVGQIPSLSLDGTIGTSSSTQYSNGFSSSGSLQGGQFSIQEFTSSGAINSNTGSNISQSQVDKSKITKKGDWAKGWDFEKERKFVKQILQIPKISQLSGSALSDKKSNGLYSTVTLDWSGKHPVGIAEYSISIDGYSDPVKLSDISSESGMLVAEFISDGLVDQIVYDDNTYGSLFQPADNQNNKNYSIGDIPLSGLSNTSPTLGNFSATGSSNQAWRTVGKKQKIVIPFLSQIHDEGNYDIWIRARGAGGYTLERLSSINIDYWGTSTSSSDFDTSKRESSLTSSDNTPPSTPSVYDRGDTTSSLIQIMANWSSNDYESGIQEYHYQVGNYSGNQFNNVTPWISAGGQTEMIIRLDQQLIPGKVYYVKVKAINGAGLWSAEGISNGIQLKDPTPPKKTRISTITLNDSILTAAWSPSSDPESGVIGYLFSLGNSSGSSDIINWCATQSTSLSLNKSQLNKISKAILLKNTTYYFSVKAMNGLGVVGEINTKAVIMI
jgi:hypothetical protein